MAQLNINVDELGRLYGQETLRKVMAILTILGTPEQYVARAKEIKAIADLADLLQRESWPEARARRLLEMGDSFMQSTGTMASLTPGIHDDIARGTAIVLARNISRALTGEEPDDRFFRLSGETLQSQWDAYVRNRTNYELYEKQVSTTGMDTARAHGLKESAAGMSTAAFLYLVNAFLDGWLQGVWNWYSVEAFIDAWNRGYLMP